MLKLVIKLEILIVFVFLLVLVFFVVLIEDIYFEFVVIFSGIILLGILIKCFLCIIFCDNLLIIVFNFVEVE